jgi:release factor glutamine methyltransferase
MDAPNFLAAGGRIQLVQSSLSEVNRTIEMFYELDWQAMVVAQVKVAFENIVLVEAKR